jgi:hypothetical protein
MTTVYQSLINDFRRKLLTDTLTRNRGFMGKAAKELGIHRNSFTRCCAELGIQPREIRTQITGRDKWKRKPLKRIVPKSRARKLPKKRRPEDIVAASERLARLETMLSSRPN